MKHVIHNRAHVDKTARLETPVRLERFVHVSGNCSIGRMTYLSEYAAVARGSSIGRFCSIARFVEIGALDHPMTFMSTHPFQYSTHHFKGQPEWDGIARVDFPDPPGPRIGHDVWIGAKATVLRGTTIGTGAVIGAGSVVNRSIPPYAIAAGVPAKVIRHRFPEEIARRLLASRWWDRPLEQLSGLPFNDVEAALTRLEAMGPPPET